MKYKIQTEFKTPWIGKPYVEYQLVKMWQKWVMHYPSIYGDYEDQSLVIFKSHDKALVEKFLNQLQEV